MSRKRVVSEDGKIIVTKVEKEEHEAFMRWCKTNKVSAGAVLRNFVATMANVQRGNEEEVGTLQETADDINKNQPTNEPLPEVAVQPPAWQPATSSATQEPYVPSILS